MTVQPATAKVVQNAWDWRNNLSENAILFLAPSTQNEVREP